MSSATDLPGNVVRPHRNLRSLYLTYLLIAIWVGIFPWLIPASFLLPPASVLAIALPILLLVIAFIWWTGAYHRTIIYRPTEDGVIWERGVWRRQAGIIPYDQITAIDITQSRLSRPFGISVLNIWIEGFPAGTPPRIGLKIEGQTDAESLRRLLLERMSSKKNSEVPSLQGGKKPSDNEYKE